MATPTLSRIHNVRERLGDTLSAHPNELVALFSRFVNQGKGMRSNCFAEYEAVIPEVDREKLKDGVFEDVLKAAQEAIILPPWVALAIRPRPGIWEYVRVNMSQLAVEELMVLEYLQFKEELVDGGSQNNFVLQLDFEPFNASFPLPLSIIGRPPPRQRFQILISRLRRREGFGFQREEEQKKKKFERGPKRT